MSVLTCPVCGNRVNADAAHCPECGADPHLTPEAARADLEAAQREQAARRAATAGADRDSYAGPVVITVVGGLLVGVLGVFSMYAAGMGERQNSAGAVAVNLTGMLLMFVAAAIMSSHARPGCSLAALGVVLGVLGAVYNTVG